MLNIGSKITELRKKAGMSQSELASSIGASRDMIGKYERDENLPSVEVAIKLAKTFNVSVDFLLGEGLNASYDKDTIRRLDDICNLDKDSKHVLFTVIDTFLRDSKARQAYNIAS